METATLPRAILEALHIPAEDYRSYLVILAEDSSVTCPVCRDGRALALAILTQSATGRWDRYSCLVCGGALR